ncbi:2OG-FE(II) OXYGENASE FAMILY PROTEIN [Salix koriyanagi]|uniref:DNA N(6)-methyladenine demethylase n=1 Tax=Salix koriyanagi TaxID=2511006 RepID=A0A9Q0V0Z5_9ROSI|nr:2OG-FE(II) OXYGENASE FAMILY PROTEIN [Salix koriyanagi]
MVYMYRLIQAKNFRLLTSPVSVPSISRQVCSGLLSIRNMNSGKDGASEDSIPGRGGAGIKLRPSPDCIDRREWRGAEETSSDGLGARHGSFSKRRSRIDLRKWRKTRKMLNISLRRDKECCGLGWFFLKRYISLSDQIELVKTCREIGLGPGGFYRPGYKNGAKLRLQMMCLGLNWDPETRKYEDQDPTDGCKPPYIPREFNQMVETAIQDAHALLGKDLALSNVEEILPAMSPDICIVNFYTTTGKLGLHQDRDESSESLSKGLPVVSFSVGDSAEFLYGDQRDVNKADKIVLESGDVLIFGGSSRHIFHGVTSVIPDSSPKALIEETRLRPGRLNLTFRQY